MEKNRTEGKGDKNAEPDWDIRFGEWKSLGSSLFGPNISSYSTLLSDEESVVIVREFKLCNTETEGNRFLIKNNSAYNLFYGIERSNCSDKICICGHKRAFNLTFFDCNRQPALYLYRPFRVGCCGLIPCCRQKIEIKDNLLKSIGEVTENCNLFRFSLTIKSNDKELQVYGPSCCTNFSYCLDDLCFNIYDNTADKPKLRSGHICKLSEFNSGGHIYRIKFGKDWTPELKSAIIGATILIDYNFFENTYHESKYHRLSLSSAQQTLPPFPLVNRYDESHPNNETEADVKPIN